jgi:microcystin-dependent protein
MLVNGAVSTLTNACFWQERDGGQTIADTIEVFTEMWLDYIGEAENMIGAVFALAADVLPNNMLWCDGTEYLRTDFPDLYGRLAAAFIVDADHFIVPDLRARMVVGSGTDGTLTDRAIGDTGGEETHQLTVSELASHNHGIFTISALSAVGSGDPNTPYIENITPLNETGYTGDDEAHNNMPPFMALKYAIVAKSRDCC